MDARIPAGSRERMKRKGSERSPESEERGSASVRLDKWLWAARFYRTRALAVAAIEAGHVRVNGERVSRRMRFVRCRAFAYARKR